MQRIMLKSKIHRATVTQAELHYQGSVTVDEDLLEAADILPYEQVQIYDVTNGNRLTTYAIAGTRGSGVLCINGAAAHLIHPGDLVILATYAQYADVEARRHQAMIVMVDDENRRLETVDVETVDVETVDVETVDVETVDVETVEAE